MDLQQLKQLIDSNEYQGQPVIFMTNGNTFLPFQYIEAMSKIRKLPIVSVNSLDELISNKADIFDTESSPEYIKVYSVDDLNFTEKSFLSQTDIIIITKTIKDSATAQLFKDVIIDLPKLENWQLKSYLYSNGKGVDTKYLDWLLAICKDDIFRLDQELAKISIFSEAERKYVFQDFVENGIFDDLTSSSVFNLVNAITGRDIGKLVEIYQDINNIEISEFGLITLLYSNFKNIINIQLGNNPTPEKLGMNPKQFAAIKYSCGRYTPQQLVRIFELLTEMDFKVKTGQLPTDILIDYIIVKILSF